jgi:hypothetical protein
MYYFWDNFFQGLDMHGSRGAQGEIAFQEKKGMLENNATRCVNIYHPLHH